MSIITETETNIINTFIDATRAGKLVWEKGKDRGMFCYFAPLVDNQNGFVEKYYAFSDDISKECFNFSIEKNATEIVIQITECIETEHIYQLIKSLFELVEIKFKEKDYESKTAILSEITGSLHA